MAAITSCYHHFPLCHDDGGDDDGGDDGGGDCGHDGGDDGGDYYGGGDCGHDGGGEGGESPLVMLIGCNNFLFPPLPSLSRAAQSPRLL